MSCHSGDFRMVVGGLDFSRPTSKVEVVGLTVGDVPRCMRDLPDFPIKVRRPATALMSGRCDCFCVTNKDKKVYLIKSRRSWKLKIIEHELQMLSN